MAEKVLLNMVQPFWKNKNYSLPKTLQICDRSRNR